MNNRHFFALPNNIIRIITYKHCLTVIIYYQYYKDIDFCIRLKETPYLHYFTKSMIMPHGLTASPLLYAKEFTQYCIIKTQYKSLSKVSKGNCFHCRWLEII